MNREQWERDVAAAFAELIADATGSGTVDWSAVESLAAEIYRDRVQVAIAAVLALMLSDELLARSGPAATAWLAAQSATFSQLFAQNLRSAVVSGVVVDAGARAATIAATEITRAITAGERIARAATASFPPISPVGPLDVDGSEAVFWLTEADKNVCPICGPLHGLRYESWVDRFPDGPPAHPNCRCRLDYRRS